MSTPSAVIIVLQDSIWEHLDKAKALYADYLEAKEIFDTRMRDAAYSLSKALAIADFLDADLVESADVGAKPEHYVEHIESITAEWDEVIRTKAHDYARPAPPEEGSVDEEPF